MIKPCKKETQNFPKLRCIHCKNLIQLDFDPKRNQKELSKVKCKKCKRKAK